MTVPQTHETDVLVVGGGPGGAAAAYHLARHGIDVTVVEKSSYPRTKVCGDGITPRGVAAMLKMGIDTDDARFEKVNGLRVHSRNATIDLPWPDLTDWPPYGLVSPREEFDQILIQRAQKAGAKLMEKTEAVSPIIDYGWVRGGVVKAADAGDGVESSETHISARFVIASDGAASRFAKPAGIKRDDTRPMGIAARRYYRTDYHPGPWFESWLDLWDGEMLLPGYGWLFPMADGRINLGGGLLNTFKNFKEISAQRLFDAFARMLGPDYGVSEENAEGRVLSGPLPMSMNRTPQVVPGMLLIGDAAGMVNPFNGEGIAYAMETGEIAAELVHEALVTDRPGLTMSYPKVLEDRYGDYFTIGRGFAKMVGKPKIMGTATKYLLPRPGVMGFAMRVMANLTDGKDGDFQDKLFYVLQKIAKAA